MRVFILLGGLVGVSSALAGPAQAQVLPGETHYTRELDRYSAMMSEGVNQLTIQWEQACQRRDAVAVAALYGKDAPIVTSNGVAARGRVAIERMFARNLARLSQMKLLVFDIVASGQLAYVTGYLSYAVSFSGSGDGYTVRVPYSMAIRQLRDGWQIDAQTGGQLPPVIEILDGLREQLAVSSGDTVRIKLVDPNGNGEGGELVAFEVLSGGGTAFPALVETDNSGAATTYVTTGTQPGLNVFRARAAALPAEPVSFSVTTRTDLGTPLSQEETADSLRSR